MLDIELIKDTIQELEHGETNFTTCEQLASLYVILNNFNPITKLTSVEDELNDILPTYKEYCNIKREYQLNKIPKETVLNSLENLCREVYQFISTLRSSTDMEEERIIIKNMIKNISE